MNPRGEETHQRLRSHTPSLHPASIQVGSTETPATCGPLEGPDWHWGGNDRSQDRQRAEEGEKARANRLWKAINPEQRIWGTGEEPPASPGGGAEINKTLQDLAVWELPRCFQLRLDPTSQLSPESLGVGPGKLCWEKSQKTN